MFEQLASRPDPILYFVAVFPLSLLALVIGYRYASRFDMAQSEQAAWAFGVAQAAIFALIALIVGFSFSFAAGRFEARRALVVTETDVIRTAYLRAGFLPETKSARFRTLLVDYVKNRLQAYRDVGNAPAEKRSIERADELQGLLWAIAASTARRNPGSSFYVDLTRSVVEIIDVADQQQAALNNHVPRPIIGIILLCTLSGALLLGLTFGRAKAPNALLSVLFCLLFTATVFTIVDLDHPQAGFISVDITPLQDALEDMTSAPSERLIRAPVSRLENAGVTFPRPAPPHRIPR